jgi:hypothetical protein
MRIQLIRSFFKKKKHNSEEGGGSDYISIIINVFPGYAREIRETEKTKTRVWQRREQTGGHKVRLPFPKNLSVFWGRRETERGTQKWQAIWDEPNNLRPLTKKQRRTSTEDKRHQLHSFTRQSRTRVRNSANKEALVRYLET